MQLSSEINSSSAAQFAAWLASPLGQYVLAQEQHFFDAAVADVFGYYALQLELPNVLLLRNNRMPSQWHAGLSHDCDLRCDPAQLPFAAASVDLLVMPHTLDFHPDPHAVLREAERVLVPEGRLMLSGFNPWSLWGVARLANRRRAMPWQAHFLSLPRVRDWLALLGFSHHDSRLYCYAPPLASPALHARLRCLDFAGQRRWQLGGGIYCLDAVKRVRGMRLIGPPWKKRATVVRPIVVAMPERHVTHDD